ncbi:hypothetical protein NC653_016896 [Populus alba x Populus x berolinensis]|uniref:Uncharacterized protein n=1 Tax=Populus alba x Populus x berolinensis TaxID=444605 RepID=A0AAD6QNY8_9ROSI|nr:hypothetical protein NC653_016896 [Populus alba x Populus x berolinensis]
MKNLATDASIWSCPLALIDFMEDLRSGDGASKHRELPQCPAPSIVVSCCAPDACSPPNNIGQS